MSEYGLLFHNMLSSVETRSQDRFSMRKYRKRLLFVPIVFLSVNSYRILIPAPFRPRINELIDSLTLEDINALRAQIFSRNIDYGKRVQIASTLTQLFEIQIGPAMPDVYVSIFTIRWRPFWKTNLLRKTVQEPFAGFAQSIDRGTTQDTAMSIEGLIANASDAGPVSRSLASGLEAETMAPSYRVLYADFSIKNSLPIRFTSLEFWRRGKNVHRRRTVSDARQRSSWFAHPGTMLSIDLAKLFTVNQKNDEAQQIVKIFWIKSPRPPGAEYFNIQ
jgi:hypothetical protein